MSNEEWERKVAFIVEQQAQFSVDIQLLGEAHKQTEQTVAQTAQNLAETGQNLARTEQDLAQTEQIVAQTGEIVGRLASVTLAGFKDVNAKIDALVDCQIRSDEKFNVSQIRIDEKFEALANSQIRSDEKFDASQTSTNEKFKALADSQIRSDEKLRNFIAGLDRYFNKGRNNG